MKIHFIGIGGIGVSALARYYIKRGWEVSGSDIAESEITQDLQRLGASISIGFHKPENISTDVKKVVHSVAANRNNPELEEAKRLNIQTQTYPQALGDLTKEYFTIAICGAHGKGTTTALISLILIEAGFDPTVIVGTNLREFGGGNCRVGESDHLVIEADEYQKAFLNYWPQIIVATNIDKEHLDCYRDVEDIISVFGKFFSHLPKDGTLIINKDNNNLLIFRKSISKQLLKKGDKGPRFSIRDYSLQQLEVKELRRMLRVPGKHNVSNALAALTLARTIKIPDKTSFKAISNYHGAWRRFEIHETTMDKKKITIVSDYAHHPTEIKATLQGAREQFGKRKIWAVFQPHQYQRTYYLFDKFTDAFTEADEIVITQIYSVAGREKKEIMQKVSGQKLAQAIQNKGKNVHFIENHQDIPDFLKKRVKPEDVILIMGAGSIYKIVRRLA